jgi:hypothetical protein
MFIVFSYNRFTFIEQARIISSCRTSSGSIASHGMFLLRMHRSQPCWEAVHGGGAEGSGGCSMGSAGCVGVGTGFSVDQGDVAGSCGMAGGGSVSGDGGVGVSGGGGVADRNSATGSGASNGRTGLGEPSQSQMPSRPAQAQVRVLRSAVGTARAMRVEVDASGTCRRGGKRDNSNTPSQSRSSSALHRRLAAFLARFSGGETRGDGDGAGGGCEGDGGDGGCCRGGGGDARWRLGGSAGWLCGEGQWWYC